MVKVKDLCPFLKPGFEAHNVDLVHRLGGQPQKDSGSVDLAPARDCGSAAPWIVAAVNRVARDFSYPGVRSRRRWGEAARHTQMGTQQETARTRR